MVRYFQPNDYRYFILVYHDEYRANNVPSVRTGVNTVLLRTDAMKKNIMVLLRNLHYTQYSDLVLEEILPIIAQGNVEVKEVSSKETDEYIDRYKMLLLI